MDQTASDVPALHVHQTVAKIAHDSRTHRDIGESGNSNVSIHEDVHVETVKKRQKRSLPQETNAGEANADDDEQAAAVQDPFFMEPVMVDPGAVTEIKHEKAGSKFPHRR